MKIILFSLALFSFLTITLAKNEHQYENPYADKYKESSQKAKDEPLGLEDIPLESLFNLFGTDEMKSALGFMDYVMSNPVFAPCDKATNTHGIPENRIIKRQLSNALTRVMCVMNNWEMIAERLVNEGHVAGILELVRNMLEGYQQKYRHKEL